MCNKYHCFTHDYELKLLLYLYSSKKNPYELAERDCETAECCEMPDDVTLSGTDIEDYRNLFASVLVLYNTLIVGKVIGQGTYTKHA